MEKFLEFFKQVLDRSGVTPFVAGGAIFSIYLLAMELLVSGETAVIAMCVVVIAFFVYRYFDEKVDYCECEPEEEEGGA